MGGALTSIMPRTGQVHGPYPRGQRALCRSGCASARTAAQRLALHRALDILDVAAELPERLAHRRHLGAGRTYDEHALQRRALLLREHLFGGEAAVAQFL